MIKKNLNNVPTKYQPGGFLRKLVTPKENTKYNIFSDPNSYEARDRHRASLDAFIQNNPSLYGINTADFAEFFSQLAGLESSYKRDAGKDMTYSGYYGLKGGRDLDPNSQHKMAYQHLSNLMKNSMVHEDLEKGLKMGYTPAQILAKYWNQANRVTNFLHRGIDDTDGVGSKISSYANNMTANVDYERYLQDGITDDYVLVKSYKTLPDAIKRARNPYINYSDRDDSVINLNTDVKQHNTGKNSAVFDAKKLQINDTIWLSPPKYLK